MPFIRAVSSVLVRSDTSVVFGGGTVVEARFEGVAGAGRVEVERFRRAPANVDGVAEPVLLGYRWVASLDSTLAFGSPSEIAFRLSEIPNLTAQSPEALVVYRRATPGSGPFTALLTRLDSTGAVVSTGVTALGEFVLATTETGNGTPNEDAPGDGDAPAALALTAFPNPASGSVSLRMALPLPGPTRLAVYDALGREVARLVDGDRPAGDQTVVLDTDQLAPGVYVVRIESGGEVATRTLTVVR